MRRQTAGGWRPAVVGHRGSPRCAPENTPASFAAAAAQGADYVEVDVRPCRGGTLVLAHDPHTADGVPLVEQTPAELRTHDIWTFAEALDQLVPGLGLDVEVKNLPHEVGYDESDDVAARVARQLGDTPAHRPVVVTSFNPLTVAALRDRLPGVPVGLLHADFVPVPAALLVATRVGAALLCPHRASRGVDGAGIARVHQAGLVVLVWGVNDPAEAAALKAAGADALCTDEPAAILAAVAGV